jgi:hypothetical protein
MVNSLRQIVRLSACAGLLIATGCGMIADKNNIRVAVLDGENITRGELNDYIRAFPENERPQIANQGDLMMVLNRMIDERIKASLVAEQGDSVPSTISRDQMREQFFKSLGDEQEQYRAVWNMEIPADGQATPLMEVYGLTADSLRQMKEFIESRTEAMYQRTRGDEIVAMLVADALQKGEIKPDEKALELEYKFRAADLKRPEMVTITALRFEASQAGAAEAAQVRTAIDAGATFDSYLTQMQQKNPALVFQGSLRHERGKNNLEGFWTQASGATAGTLLGPLFMPETQQVAISPDGKQRQVTSPPSYIVCRIDAREDERTMTLQEAVPIIGPPLLIADMVRKLREQHGVQVFEENLSDPSDFADAKQKPLA